jgi:hypothetical protein
MRIVTMSARIAMPRGFARIVDVRGELGTFGTLTSPASILTAVRVPLALQHTNIELPFHLDAAAMLRSILAQ